MKDFLNLKNKKIIVTGASSGIGRKTAIELSEYGANVVLIARDQNRLVETKNMMQGGEHQIISSDLRDFDLYSEMFREIMQDGKKVNGLVHCAGIAYPVPAKAISQQAIKEMFEVNFFAFMELVKFFTKKRFVDNPSIVAVSALNSISPRKCMSIYSSSKGALNAAVKSFACEFIGKNIRVNAVIPGPVETPMAIDSAQHYGMNIDEGENLGMIQSEDIANAILFLLSDSSKFITGRSIYVDGGRL